MNATSNSMNFLMQKSDAHLSLKVPKEMRDLIHEQAKSKNMTDSNYVKMVLQERLQKDLKV